MAGATNVGRNKRRRSNQEDHDDAAPSFSSCTAAAAAAVPPPPPPPRRPAARTTNPFLPAAAGGGTDDADDALLTHVLAFAAGSAGALDPHRDHAGAISFHQGVAHLIGVLTARGDGAAAAFTTTPRSRSNAALVVGGVTRAEIALLLLPWSLQRAQQQQPMVPTRRGGLAGGAAAENTLVWRALSASVTFLHRDAASAAALQRIVTQSALVRLVPKIAILAANGDDSCGAHIFAAYQALLPLFGPAMDVACKAVLLPLLDHTASTTATTTRPCTANAPSSRTVLATLRWMQSIHHSRRGNPKTTFQLLAEPPVLVALARYYADSNDDCDTEHHSHSDAAAAARQGLDVLRDLLWDGLFHPRHHIEGFVTLLLSNSKDAVGTNGAATTAAPLRASVPPPVRNVADAPTPELDAPIPPPHAAFQSYHAGLLIAVGECLAGASDGRSAIVRLLPVLLRGYFQQSRDWDRSRRPPPPSSSSARGPRHRRSDTNHAAVTVGQFQLFQQWACPLLDMPPPPSARDNQAAAAAADRLAASSLSALRQMLELVHEFSVYTPSQQDQEGGDQYRFLQRVASHILETPFSADDNDDDNDMDDDNDDGTRPRARRQMSDAIRGLRALLLLHHRLLHDRVVDAVALGLRGCGAGTASGLGADFLATVVDTYRQLRQQRYLFASLLGVVQRSRDTNAGGDLTFFLSLLRAPKLAASIAVAVEASPIVEVTEIFRTISAWIVALCSAVDGGNTTTTGDQASLDVVVRLSNLLTRHARVDRGTAADVATACREFTIGAVQTLAQQRGAATKVESRSGAAAAAMTLCGLVLDLHTRCVFWLGRGVVLDIPSETYAALQSAVDGASSASGSEPFSDGARVLACHRLRHLHSLIHDLEREAMEQSSSVDGSTALVVEATRLAAFIASGGEEASQYRGHQWIDVAQNFSSWIAYASDHHICRFLAWVVSESARPLSLSKVDLPVLSTGSNEVHPPSHVGEQGEVAACLLRDASFFQHTEVVTRISSVGLSVAAECVLAAVGSGSTSAAELTKLLSTPLGNDVTRHSKTLKLVVGSSHISFDFKPDSLPDLENALRSILLINGLQCGGHSEVDLVAFLDLTLRIDHVCRSLYSADRTLFSTALSIVSALRLSLVKIFASSSAELIKAFLFLSADIAGIVCCLIQSATSLMAGESQDAELVDVTGQLVERLIAGAASTSIDKDTLESLSTGFASIAEAAARSAHETSALFAIARRLMEGLSFTQWPTLYPSENEVTTNLAALFDTIQGIAFKSDESSSLDASEGYVSQDASDSSVFSERLLLLGDLLHSNEVSWLSQDSHALEMMQRRCIESLRRSHTELFSEHSWNAMSYLTGRLTLVRPTNDLTAPIADALLCVMSAKYNASLLEAAFYHLAPALNGQDLVSVLAKLTSEVDDLALPTSVKSRLRLVKLLLRFLVNEDQIELLSSNSRNIFALTLMPMRGDAGESLRAENVVATLSLLDDLLKRRDILLLKERDLALILSNVVSVLGPSANTSNAENQDDSTLVEDDIGTSVYIFAADMFATMLQRYAKVLYACVPSVISTLRCFLCQAIYAPLPDQSIALRGQRFTRLCELLVGHRGIYKKHVVGLVLEFVVGLGQLMSLHRRDCLVPAIYFLLDTMSTFEMQQLNAFMDGKAKILFRTVHQSYQKVHAYKGQ